MKNTTAKFPIYILILMLVMIAITFIVVNKQNKIILNIAELDEKSDEVIYRTQKILTTANEIEFSINDFLFAKNPNSFKSIQENKNLIDAEIKSIIKLREKNQIIKSKIDSITLYVDKQNKFAKQLFILQSKNNINSKNRLNFLFENKLNTTKIHKKIDQIHLEENKYMLKQSKDHQISSFRAAGLLIVSIIT